MASTEGESLKVEETMHKLLQHGIPSCANNRVTHVPFRQYPATSTSTSTLPGAWSSLARLRIDAARVRGTMWLHDVAQMQRDSEFFEEPDVLPKLFPTAECMKRFFSNSVRMSTKRISYKVDGEVQGVNFRSFTHKQANSIGVTGFVTNASDGTVQGEAQGTEDKLKEFVQHLNSGPSAASVTGVEHDDIPTKSGESGFRVK